MVDEQITINAGAKIGVCAGRVEINDAVGHLAIGVGRRVVRTYPTIKRSGIIDNGAVFEADRAPRSATLKRAVTGNDAVVGRTGVDAAADSNRVAWSRLIEITPSVCALLPVTMQLSRVEAPAPPPLFAVLLVMRN